MKKNSKAKAKVSVNGDGLNFEAQLWAAAEKMRGHMDDSEYKHVALGLIRGIEADIVKEHAESFRHAQHPDLRAGFVIATALVDSASNPAEPNGR